MQLSKAVVVALLFVSAPLYASHASLGSGVYHDVFQSVNALELQTLLKNLTGSNPVTVNGKTFSITDRYLPESKAKFRAYWADFFRSLGLTVNELDYPTEHQIGETSGHNLEAVLPGKSKDSVVIIVHYDSIGPLGDEANNPGVDDDMSGMATMLETAQILTQYQGRLRYTLRFVAADYEEQIGLEGARKYAGYIKDLATKEGFQIVAAIDNEQSGWNCFKDGLCGDSSQGDTFDVFSCSVNGNYNFPQIGDALSETAKQYSHLKVQRDCIGENSDHYAMWEIGVPAVVFSEHMPFVNPHFDSEGGDTYDKIDQDYYFSLAQVGVTFAAQMVGISD